MWAWHVRYCPGFVAVFTLSYNGHAIYGLVSLLEKRLLTWQRSSVPMVNHKGVFQDQLEILARQVVAKVRLL